jgi:WXXGXW repeat (2 copies)
MSERTALKKNLKFSPIYILALGCIAFALTGCHKNPGAEPQNSVAAQAADQSQDPAKQANLAPVSTSAPPEETAPPPPSDETSSAPPATYTSDNGDYSYNAPPAQDESYDTSDEPVTYAPDPPPPLPEYEQPECPGPDYIWTPGYWSYAPTGYYWVPGVWIIAPYVGALWTPGYWGFYGGRYLWHYGYWGPHIGFYGGVNYGYGYTGVGYVGGYWNNGAFMYNRDVTRVNTTIIHSTYAHRVTVVNNTRVSYNGGRGGLNARPIASERVAARERHMAPLPAQHAHMREAAANRSQWANVNHGRPTTLVAARPLNTGRQRPEATPTAVREQVQREQAGRQQLSRASNQVRPATRPNTPINRPETQRETRPGQRPSTNRPAARPENHPAARPQQHPEARPQPRPEARPQSRPEMRPEQRPQPRPQARPEARPMPRQQARPEPRPAARPQPRTEQHPQGHSEQHSQPHGNDDRRPHR